MKKTRSKIIIKTRKGGYTKIYANGKWQKGVYNIDFHAGCTPFRCHLPSGRPPPATRAGTGFQNPSIPALPYGCNCMSC